MSDCPNIPNTPSRPGQLLNLDVRQHGPATVIHVRGSAGMREAELMRATLEQAAASQASMIVLDLSQMDFICSMGLGAIIQGHLRSRHHAGQIRLVNPQPAVMELLETTRLTKLFQIFPTLDQAIQGS